MNYYRVGWMPGVALVGLVVLFTLPYLALFWLLVLLLAAAAALVVLARAVVVGAPRLLARSAHRWRQRRSSARRPDAGSAGRELKLERNEEM